MSLERWTRRAPAATAAAATARVPSTLTLGVVHAIGGVHDDVGARGADARRAPRGRRGRRARRSRRSPTTSHPAAGRLAPQLAAEIATQPGDEQAPHARTVSGGARSARAHAARSTPTPIGSQRTARGRRPGRRALALDGVAALAEVLPALVVDRDRRARARRGRTARPPRGRSSCSAAGPETGKRTPPRCRSAVSTVQAVGDLAHAVVEHRVARDPQHAVLLAVPAQREADHVADDRAAERRPVAARRRGDLDRRPVRAPRGASSAHGASPRAPIRRGAWRPATVVTTRPAAGSSARPAGSRLSPWWSWLSRTASIGAELGRPRSPGRRACATPCPSRRSSARPGGSNVGSVSSRQPPTSISTVGPPMWVRRTSRHALRGARLRRVARAPSRARSRRPPPTRPRRAAGAGPRTP